MSIEQAIERAAKELPEGFEIEICIENGAGYVTGNDAEGVSLPIDSADMSIEEQINECVDCAIDLVNGWAV